MCRDDICAVYLFLVGNTGCRSGCTNFDEWEVNARQRAGRPSYPDGAAPVIPHPKLRDIIHKESEPLYTHKPIGKPPNSL